MHIVMVTKPEAFMETDVLKDARTRCISLFFKSLTSRADQVCTCGVIRNYPRRTWYTIPPQFAQMNDITISI